MKKCANCGFENEDDANFCTECKTPFRTRDTVGSIETALPPTLQPKQASSLLLEPGEVFAGRYEIIEKIGQGGMGVVYKTREKLGSSVERDIALKLIRSELLVNEAAIDKLVHEGVLTQKIRHKNVVAVHNVGVFEGQPFVAMEFVDGLSMREWLRRKFNFRDADGLRVEIPFAVAAQVVRALLDGLEAAHELGIVHRDLKPENVIFTGEPDAEKASLQILDFGIARSPGPALSTASGAMGTYEYMAQEQKTNPAGVEPAADLYSLSIIFYEMLMDVLPKNEGRDLAGTRGDVPDGVSALISKGLANSPRGRPQSVAEYRTALDTAMGRGTVKPRPEPKPEPKPIKPVRPDKPIPPPPEPIEIPKGAKIGGGIALGLFAVIGLSQCDPDDNGTTPDDWGEQQLSSGSVSSSSTSGNIDPPPPPPPEDPNYAVLSGRWTFQDGTWLDMPVAPDGTFNFQSSDQMGNFLNITGSITDGEYYLQNRNGQFDGNIEQTSDCSLNYELFNENGGLTDRGTIRISQPPGVGPCS